MSFLNPFFLLALSAVALPLVIHLINFRKPRKILFSTLAFFEELQKSTIRKIKIKRYLLLVLRVLAVTCLALVLARPFIPPVFGFFTNSSQPAIIALLLDNSISMARVGEGGPLTEQAKAAAEQIIASSGAEDRFVLQFTSGKALNTSLLSAGQLRRELEQIETAASGTYTTRRLEQLSGLLKEAPYQNKKLFIISDGRFMADETFAETLNELPATVSSTFIQLADAAVQNTYVSGLTSNSELLGAGAPFNLQVQVKNGSSAAAVNQFLSLITDGEVQGQYPLELRPGETQTFSFEMIPEKAGFFNGRLLIEGDDFVADNTYYFSVEIPDKRKVLLVRDRTSAPADFSLTNTVLDAPGKGGAQLEYSRITVEELENTDLEAFDAVILEEMVRIPEYSFEPLRDFVQSGGGILIFPALNADINNYNGFTALFNAGGIADAAGEPGSLRPVASGSGLLEDHPVFEGLFERGNEDEQLTFAAPDIYYYYKLETPGSGAGLNLITLNTGAPLVREKAFGQGKILMSAIGNSPAWSDFPVKALFPAFYYRTILYAASSQKGGLAKHTLGQKFLWEGELEAQNVSLTAGGHEIRVAPRRLGRKIAFEYPAEDFEAGWIEVSDGSRSAYAAANLPPEESDFSADITLDTLIAQTTAHHINAASLNTAQLAESIKSSGFGKEIWNWFLLAGIILLVAESLVSVYFKAETI